MKYVVVTGGTSGMGRAVSKMLAENGYYVFSLDIKENDEPCKNIEQIKTDITNFKEIQKARETIMQKTDKLDAVLNFAGIIMMNSLIEIAEEEFIKIFNINVFGAYRINKVFFDMVQKGKGKIIITTSEVASNKVLPFNGIYGITKKALDAYAEGLAMELGILGIPVIRLRPGAVKTELIDNSSSQMERFGANTVIYKDILPRFKHIVDKEQGTAIPAEKIAKLVLKILKSNKPKLVYAKNTSKKLKLLSVVPEKMQVAIYKKLLIK
ncbi:MAG: SDR family NAD(P)-dependent oxidoreductase [Clostridia bacterium]|nr:SDR family NAD(P)-dependent oxidoreductase [Clostridia bacterium]